MPKLRILADDAVQRCTLLTANKTAGAMLVDYMRNPKKALVHRSTDTSLIYKIRWPDAEVISAVVAPFCNWSPAALWYIDLTDEVPATNLGRYSEQFDNAVWAKTGATVTPNYGAAPDGAVTADRAVFSGADQHLTQSTALAVGVVCSSSMWVKGIAGQTIALAAGGVDQLHALNGAWQRLKTNNKVAASSAISISTRGGATARDIQIWGAQIETGPVATSYYPATAAAATRPLGYMDDWQTYGYASGPMLACPAPAFKLAGRWTLAQSMSAYAYGGGALARAWLPPTAAVGMRITVSDPNNLQGRLETSQIMAGKYWEAKKNADYGASVVPLNLDKNSRNGAGDLVTEIGTRHVKLNFTLSKMDPEDRDNLWETLRACGSSVPVYINLAPEHDDLKYERMYSVVGKLVTTAAMSLPSFRIASSPVEVESI